MKTKLVNDFLAYVIEEYKYWENETAKNTIKLFTEHNVFDYIINHYDALHTLGGRAIADDINLLTENGKIANNV